MIMIPRTPFRTLLAVALIASGPAAVAHGPGPSDDRAQDRAAQTNDSAAQAADRATQDLAKVAADTARDQQRFAEESAKIAADAINDPAKAQEDLAKLDADRVKWDAQRTEEVAKIQSDLAEEQAKVVADFAEHQGSGSGTISDDRASSDSGSSAEMQDLAQSENPERDERGFPIRRAEVEALDLPSTDLAVAVAKGFRVIERALLKELGNSLTRLAVPPGVSEADALRQLHEISPRAIVDFSHYYAMLPAGEEANATGPTAALSRKPGKLRIGMIDTGIAAHPYFKSTKIHARSFGQGAVQYSPTHGTAVASILISEGAHDLIAADVFRGTATGAPFTSADTIAQSLDWLSQQRLGVINISLAGPRNAILDTMILRALGRGMAIVASAGNGGPAAPPAYPAALRQVIAVTAVDGANHIYRYANQGGYIAIAAPGVHEPGAAVGGGFRSFSGTSFAAPHISGWLARCLSTQRKSGLTAIAECRLRMIASASDLGEPGLDPVYGYGVIR